MTAQEQAISAGPEGGSPVVPSRGRHRPLGLDEITIDSGFWATRQLANSRNTLRHCEEWMERLGWIGNFDRVADRTTGPDRPGWNFSDSEVYKLMEALAWEHGRTGRPELDASLRRLTARVGRAQDPDGYLNTCYGHGGREARYSDLENGHELYCTGHLLQAAVARVRTLGPRDQLVDIARRAADHVCAVFGPDGKQGLCGHPEIEVGLAELGRALGEERYVEQARIFLDRRGHGALRGERAPLGSAYFQDDVPIRDAHALRGHAVRALYLAAGAVDVAVERADENLLKAVVRQWEHTVARRTHITGGMGSRHQDEGFGKDWELSADRAYCESCAGIASVMLSWRLYLATGESRFADLIERTLFNVVATSPSREGTEFFYANPLHQRVSADRTDLDALYTRAEGGIRSPWFDVSCCPTNLARTLATLQTCVASAEPEGISVLQFASGRLRAPLDDGREIGVDIRTDYPDDGTVTVRITDPPPGAVTVRLRVPSWARGAVIEEAGRRRTVDPGFAVVDRELVRGEEIVLHLPMEPRVTWPDPRIDAVRGCVAVERGPLVYCAESVDLSGVSDLDEVMVDPSVPPAYRGGRVRVRGSVRSLAATDPQWPYASDPAEGRGEPVDVVLSPYHQWAERGPTAMRVWLPVIPGADADERNRDGGGPPDANAHVVPESGS